MPTQYRMLVEMIAAGLACIALWLLLHWLITGAIAHEAPSGWKYPSECCANQDCRPIGCSTIREGGDGSASWTGLHFYKSQVKTSGDAQCHVCVSYGQLGGTPATVTRYGHCIFLSPVF